MGIYLRRSRLRVMDTLILNANPGAELDVLHRSAGLTERCNTDAIRPEDRQRVDRRTADALVQRGAARYCQHCAAGPT